MKTLKTSLILGVAVAVMGLQSARADQPHMQNALMHLREARTALQRAEHNKGGHRQRAIEKVNQAIAEVEAGIAAGH
jgi:mannose/cellobiose epimerase-like protein (N-acyl-D-glucosamine 2-epimerase family)